MAHYNRRYTQTVYIKVRAAHSWSSGTFNVRVTEYTDLYCVNDPSDLMLSFNSVPYSRVLRWDGTTQYMSEWNYAVARWNELNLISIIKGSSLNRNVQIGDYYDSSSNRVIAYYSWRPLLVDLIRFNTFEFQSMTTSQRYKTMMHELGHALGLDEMNTSGNSNISVSESLNNVMRQGKRSLNELGPCDKKVYYERWSY